MESPGRQIAGSSRNQRGVATLEMALVLPLLLLLVIGGIDYGWKFYILHNMNVAARDGAR